MAAKLDRLGVPVKLAIGLDSVFRTSLTGRVGHYINFYIANGAGTPVEKRKGFQGSLENVNVENVPGVGHMSIEKNQIMQQKVISAIDAVVFGRSAPASVARKPRPGNANVGRRSTQARRNCALERGSSPRGNGRDSERSYAALFPVRQHSRRKDRAANSANSSTIDQLERPGPSRLRGFVSLHVEITSRTAHEQSKAVCCHRDWGDAFRLRSCRAVAIRSLRTRSCDRPMRTAAAASA